MTRLGLEVNETKTRLACIPGDKITFLGYTLGQSYGKEGRPYIGTRPSRKAVKACSNGSTIERRDDGTRTPPRTQSPTSAASCAAGVAISIRGRSWKPTT